MSGEQEVDRLIMLNRLAQGHVSVRYGVEWFSDHSEVDQREILRLLVHASLQSGATAADVPAAIERAELKRTFTPCVQLLKGQLNIQLSKVVRLPMQELEKSFKLLLSLLAISDRRRREKCGNKCSHWWHRDLRDVHVIEEVREQYPRL